jgi:hypothetical protein
VLLGIDWGTHRKLEEHTENIIGSHWELCGNNIWKHGGNAKTPKNLENQTLSSQERKKLSPPECMWSFLVGCMKFVFLKRFVVAIFSPGLTLLPKSVQKRVVSSFHTHP